MSKDRDAYNCSKTEVTFVIPAFDLFGGDNGAIDAVVKDFAADNLILLTNKTTVLKDRGIAVQMMSAPVFNGDIVSKYFSYLVADLKIKGTIVFLLPFFPFRKKEHVDAALNAFFASSASFLVSMTSSGQDAEMIYITTSDHVLAAGDVFARASDSFVFMVDNVQSFKVMSSGKYLEVLASQVPPVVYSTGKQRELAAKYRDNLRDYDLEFLDNKEIVDPVVLRSSKDAPQRIEKLVSIPKGNRILDVGCSSSNVAIKYARAVGSSGYVVGIDIDKELIETAHKFLSRESESVRARTRFVCTSAEDFQDEPESFDTITATEFFEHILHTQHDQLMRHCLKFLKPEGSMIVSVPNRFVKSIYILQKRYRWDWYNHYTHFTRKSLVFFLEQYFRQIVFHRVYEEAPEEGIFLIAEGRGKR